MVYRTVVDSSNNEFLLKIKCMKNLKHHNIITKMIIKSWMIKTIKTKTNSNSNSNNKIKAKEICINR